MLFNIELGINMKKKIMSYIYSAILIVLLLIAYVCLLRGNCYTFLSRFDFDFKCYMVYLTHS